MSHLLDPIKFTAHFTILVLIVKVVLSFIVVNGPPASVVVACRDAEDLLDFLHRLSQYEQVSVCFEGKLPQCEACQSPEEFLTQLSHLGTFHQGVDITNRQEQRSLPSQ